MAGYILQTELLGGPNLTYPKGQMSDKVITATFQNFIKSRELRGPFVLHTSNRVSKLFRPLRITLTVVGRWPFQLRNVTSRSPTFSNWLFFWVEERRAKSRILSDPVHRIRLQEYTPSLKSVFWIYFILTTLFLSIVLLFSILGFCDFFLSWNLFAESSWDEEERRNFESNLVPFVLVWSCLMHSSISSISFLINRKKVAKFLNYWNYAVDAMGIDVPPGIRRYLLMSHVGFLGFLIVIFIAYRILCLNLIRGGALLVGILTFRPFIYMFDVSRDLFHIRIFGVVVILYSVYASRAFLLIFSFKIRLLRHGFKVWNKRFKTLLLSSSFGVGSKEEQTKCDKLFEDYKILLKLVRYSDKVFGLVLQSYYGSQLMNLCFELYYLARSGAYNTATMEIIAALIVLIQNLYIFFIVSLDAASVNEEAIRGAEILRESGCFPQDSIHRKYLISNMHAVFSHRIVLTGGKYFSVDRPFIVTVLGAVFTYFIIVLQVGPSLHKKLEENGA